MATHSTLENPMDRGACWATVHRVAKHQTRLKQLNMHACVLIAKTNIFDLISSLMVCSLHFWFPVFSVLSFLGLSNFFQSKILKSFICPFSFPKEFRSSLNTALLCQWLHSYFKQSYLSYFSPQIYQNLIINIFFSLNHTFYKDQWLPQGEFIREDSTGSGETNQAVIAMTKIRSFPMECMCFLIFHFKYSYLNILCCHIIIILLYLSVNIITTAS